jgi:hypothetical protein
MRNKMAIGAAAFQYVETTTSGKLDIIAWQNRIVKYRYNNEKMKGKGLSIPGHHSQLKRHIDELSDYGVAEENQIMVDWTYGIYRNLVKEAERLEFKGKIVCGDLANEVRKLWAAGEQVDVIDFDDIGYLSSNHLKLLEDACKTDVKVFVGVFATRGNASGFNKFQTSIIKNLNIQGYFHRRGNYTYSLRDIQGRAVEHTANQNSYSCHYRGYQGRSTMVSCVVVKQSDNLIFI